ncbi:MAG TPA: SCO family protein, partial [Tepidisphaeraceae bacterium]
MHDRQVIAPVSKLTQEEPRATAQRHQSMKLSFIQLRVAALALAVTVSPLLGAPGTDAPDRYEPVPPKMARDTANVSIDEKLGETVPLSLAFKDSTGRDITLKDYFRGKPVILQLGYYNCPQICDVVSHEIMKSVKDLDLSLGKDFEVLYVSINPNERWQLAQTKKRNYIDEYAVEDPEKRAAAAAGWNFLVGSELNSKAL